MKKTLMSFVVLLLIFLLLSCDAQVEEMIETDDLTAADAPAAADERTITDAPIVDSISDTDFNDSFIYLTGALSYIIDTDKLPEWDAALQETWKSSDGDPYLRGNIYEFIRFFEIPREKFEELYYSTNLYYTYDYNFDLLYGDDVEKVYEYYRKENEDLLKRNTEFKIKQCIKEHIGIEKFNDWLSAEKPVKYEYLYDTSWSIPEAIYTFEIPRGAVEGIIFQCSFDEENLPIYEVHEDGTEVMDAGFSPLIYEYDLDRIYDSSDEIKELINSGIEGYKIDELIRK